MKKRLLLLILFILFVPVVVNAEEEVSIKSIELFDKSDNSEILEPASINDLTIDLNIKMYDVNDYVKYKIVASNSTDKKLAVKNSFNTADEHMKYEIEYPDNSRYIEPNTDKEIILKVSFDKNIDKELFKNGSYDASSNVKIILTDNLIDIANTLKNLSPILIILVIIPILLGLFILIKNNKVDKTQVLLIILLIMIVPKYVRADRVFEMDINSNISVQKARALPCTYEGDLQVNTTTYVNGQYTYRYIWLDTTNEYGWIASLTDRESTEPVTSPICSVINDLPLISTAHMYEGSKTTSIDLSTLDTSNVRQMEFMFSNCQNIEEIDLSGFNTSKVLKMNYLLSNAKSLKTVNLSYFDVTNINEAYSLLNGATSLESAYIEGWDMSNREYILPYSSFNGTSNLKFVSFRNTKFPIKSYNFANNTGMLGSAIEELDFTDCDFTHTEDLSYFLQNMVSLKKIDGVNEWDVSNVTNMFAIFQNCAYLEELEISNWDTSKVTRFQYAFAGLYNIKKLVIKDLDLTSLVETAAGTFENVGRDSEDVEITIENLNMPNTPNAEQLFSYGAKNAKNVTVNIDGLIISSASTVQSMFIDFAYDSDSLIFNLNNVDISGCQNASQMFSYMGYNTSGDVEVSLTNVDAKSATTIGTAFQYIGARSNNVAITIKDWNLSSVTYADSMLQYSGVGAKTYSLLMENIDMHSLVTTRTNFYDLCRDSETCSIEFKNINLSSLTSFEYAFSYFAEDTTDLTIKGVNGLNLRNVTNLKGFFESGRPIEGMRDVGTIDLGAANVNYMFSENRYLKATLNLHDNLTNYQYMFYKAAISEDSEVIINYTSNVDIDTIMSAFADNPHIKKGSLIED